MSVPTNCFLSMQSWQCIAVHFAFASNLGTLYSAELQLASNVNKTKAGSLSEHNQLHYKLISIRNCHHAH